MQFNTSKKFRFEKSKILQVLKGNLHYSIISKSEHLLFKSDNSVTLKTILKVFSAVCFNWRHEGVV